MENTDVVIVGSGPTGLMAAALLTRCGVKIRILDKTEQQAHESRAFGVHAKSMELFLSLGLADKFLERGLVAAGVQMFVDGKQVAEINFDDIGRDDTPFPFLLMVPQWDIEDILVEDLKRLGIEVEHNTEVTHFEQSANEVIVHAKNNNQIIDIKASYLIGADGAHSIVRKTLGLDFEGAAYPQGFLLADCKIEWPYDYNHMKVFLHNRELAIYLPLKGKDFGRIITIKSLDAAAQNAATRESSGTEKATLEEVQTAVNQATLHHFTLSDPKWVTAYRIHHRATPKYSEGRVFIAGDAAHIHSPAGGQGMNTGVQDVANLAWKLALVIKGNAPTTLLNTYNDERWHIGQNILNFTDKAFAFLTSQNKWKARARNWLIPVFAGTFSRIRCFRARMFHFISQLGIRYHLNAFLLNDTTPIRKQLGAGYRAPNGSIARNFDIFDLLKGYCFHVLVFSYTPLSINEIENITQELNQIPTSIGLPVKSHIIAHTLMGRDERVIRAESNQAFKIYGINRKCPQALFLIRPDGYIAFQADRLDFPGLVGWISAHFARATLHL